MLTRELKWGDCANTNLEVSIIAIVVIKLWAVSDRLIRLEMKSDRINERIKHSFSRIKEDMSLIKKMLKRSLNNP